MEASKRPRRGKAWPNVSLFGPGGEDGGELLRQLAGEPDTLEAPDTLFAHHSPLTTHHSPRTTHHAPRTTHHLRPPGE